MNPEDVVWEFDGGDGRTDVLMSLVAQLLRTLEQLMPEEHEDTMARLAAEMSDRPVELLESSPVLARLFPAALQDPSEADQFRRDAIGQQARSRLEAGRTVLSDCAVARDDMVGVPEAHLNAWILTLGGLRAAWTVELTGSAERMAAATPGDVRANPTAATVVDWLGWVLEDALETHMLLP